MNEKAHSHANVIAPPPLVYAVGLLISFLLQWRLPIKFRFPKAAREISFGLMGLSFLLGFSALLTLRRARTTVLPHKPTTTIVAAGPFRYTRNPIYLSFNLLYIGIALLANLLWAFLLLPLVLVIMNWGVIAREERYLAHKFGEEYQQYLVRVRRWL
ncbi:MAG: isoprenylcysteine carboxylmethyltransferase family protein [Caldilineaceae bacterium]